VTSNNQVGFDQVNVPHTLDDTLSLNKEIMIELTQVHELAPCRRKEDAILDSNDCSPNKMPINEDAATETNQTN
jgi:hypothetical protein